MFNTVGVDIHHSSLDMMKIMMKITMMMINFDTRRFS